MINKENISGNIYNALFSTQDALKRQIPQYGPKKSSNLNNSKFELRDEKEKIKALDITQQYDSIFLKDEEIIKIIDEKINHPRFDYKDKIKDYEQYSIEIKSKFSEILKSKQK